MNNLALNYGTSIGFDTLRFSVTSQFQNFLKKNNKIILDNFKIDDITKHDSIFIVSIEKGRYPKFFIDLTCTETQAQNLLNDLEKNIPRHIRTYNKFIIATIVSISKIKYKIYSDIEKDDDGEPLSNLELDASDAFECQGNLIDIYDNSTK